VEGYQGHTCSTTSTRSRIPGARSQGTFGMRVVPRACYFINEKARVKDYLHRMKNGLDDDDDSLLALSWTQEGVCCM
jgi:hypothetical protein